MSIINQIIIVINKPKEVTIFLKRYRV